MMINRDAISDIRAFGDFMQQSAARNLELLRRIASTVTALRTIGKQARGFIEIVQDLTASIHAITEAIPEDVLPVFEQLQDDLASLHGLMRQKRAAAQRAAELCDGDGVCEAYSEAMEGIHGLHECIETLRWLIMEHNAELESSTGDVLTSAEEVERYLASL